MKKHISFIAYGPVSIDPRDGETEATAKIEDVLGNFTAEEIAEHFNTEELLSEIGKDKVIEWLLTQMGADELISLLMLKAA
ncbi:hypothetical protein ACSL9C_000723 [Vibrio navarrensis]